MVGMKLNLEELELPIGTPLPASVVGAGGSGSLKMVSDDKRSMAVDSWSVRSEYGSTFNGDQR
jgi:hypothetical protein